MSPLDSHHISYVYTRYGSIIHSGRGFASEVEYEVIRPLYASTSQSEITRVSFEEVFEAIYSCTVYVEGHFHLLLIMRLMCEVVQPQLSQSLVRE